MLEINKSARTAVIMPAYNAQEYIEQSVRSVLGQSFKDILLIVVNDGSVDGTQALLERIQAEDNRLLPLCVANGGPAKARNIGLDAVPEDVEYIMFADSDDILSPDALEYALDKGRGAELVLMGFCIENADGSEAGYFEPEQHMSPGDIGSSLGRLYKANLLNQVWAKLFSAKLINDNNIRFPDYRWGEDRLFIFDCLERASSVAVLPECKYRYMMRPGQSLISSYYDKKFDVCKEADLRAQQLCQHFGSGDDSDLRYMFVKSVFSCLTTLFSPNCKLSARAKREELAHIIRDGQVIERSRNSFGGASVQALCALMRTGSVTLNYAAFYLVSRIGELAPKLFTSLKHKK